jgi:site-specific recombinase XerD
VPYIYSHDELRRLLKATAACDNPHSSIESDTCRTLIVLLYGAGLRISEALALTLADVDLSGAMRFVHTSKFYKTRLVPLGPDLTRALKAYATRRAMQHPSGPEGARASEAAQLLIADLHLSASYVTILGKGDKKRQCPLWSATVRALSALITGRSQSDNVFLNRAGRPITRFGIHTLVERYVDSLQATIPSLATKRVSPHTIRHATATHLLRAGWTLTPSVPGLGTSRSTRRTFMPRPT